MTEIKFYACDYDYQKELKCLLYFTNFNLNTCHDLICIIHKCCGDYTINKDKILVEHVHQNINNLRDFCINNHLNFTIKHNLDYLYSTINHQIHPIHVDYTYEIKLSKENDKMTEKRFIFDGLHIKDTLNKIPPILAHNDEQRDEFLKGLNGLIEENKELKKHIQELSDYIEELGGWEE